jgi:hypothetical protein
MFLDYRLGQDNPRHPIADPTGTGSEVRQLFIVALFIQSLGMQLEV